MKVSRTCILARGLSNRCPNCVNASLFRPGSFFEMQACCPDCGFAFAPEQNEGLRFRALSLDFGVTVTFVSLALGALALGGWLTPDSAEVVAIAGIVVAPFGFYRSACSWTLMYTFLLFPEELPSNRSDRAP